MESLLIIEPQKTKVDLNLLLTTTINEIIGHESHIKIDYHFTKIRRIMAFHQHLKHAFIHLIKASIFTLNDKGFIKISTRLKNQTVEIEISSKEYGNQYPGHKDIHLSIAHWLIRMHNGKISVQNYFNKELIFLIHLPTGV